MDIKMPDLPNNVQHSAPEAELLQRLGTDRAKGLPRPEAARRLAEYGRNAFPEPQRKSLLRMFLAQFKDLLIIILLIATAISFGVGFYSREGGVTDAVVILAILIINAILGLSQERKADKALEALKKMSVPQCEVIRDGQIQEISSEEVVPGDLVVLREGDFIPADMRMTEAYNLRVDEASLTGESVPVEKQVEPTPKDAPLADRNNMGYAGTHAVYGRGRGIVVATGMQREIGRIASFMQQQEEVGTPLQRNLAGLGKLLGIGVLVICGIVFIVGVSKGEHVLNMFMTAVSLAVAAIPEGLPAIVTIVLAVGVYRMSKQHAIVRKLPAVETLGSATYICTDKTGTLTQNRMTVLRSVTMQELNNAGADAASTQRNMMRISVLCNDSHIERGSLEVKRYGDPTELAFVDYAERQNVDVAEMRREFPRLHEAPFDSTRKMMSTLHLVGDRYVMMVKGAPDNVLDRCASYEVDGKPTPLSKEDKARALAAMEEMAAKALRVLAFAWKELGDRRSISPEGEKELVFVGLMGMMDPARPEVRDSVREAAEAGIQCAMITGDNMLTAKAVAEEIGMFKPGDETITGPELEKVSEEDLTRRILNIRVFARVWPEQKLRIVKALQDNGEVVAMTGDGVNDAPALKKADIGVAMGITGTEVAKETSDVVLTDDNFATIVHAIKEGRVIFDNIRKFVMYLLACNVGEIFSIFVPILIGLSSPLRPVQILLVNLVTDGVVALSLGVDPPEKDIMKRRPRKSAIGIIGKMDIIFILYNAAFITLAVTLSYLIGKRMNGVDSGKTMAFVTLSIAELWRAFSFRSSTKNVWQLSPFSNIYLIWAALSSAVIVAATVLVDPLRIVFGNTWLSGDAWLVTILLSLVPLLAAEIWTFARRTLFSAKAA